MGWWEEHRKHTFDLTDEGRGREGFIFCLNCGCKHKEDAYECPSCGRENTTIRKREHFLTFHNWNNLGVSYPESLRASKMEDLIDTPASRVHGMRRYRWKKMSPQEREEFLGNMRKGRRRIFGCLLVFSLFIYSFKWVSPYLSDYLQSVRSKVDETDP